VLDLHEDDGQVVDKEEGIHHAAGILDNVVILYPSSLLVKYSDPIKEPKSKYENKEKSTNTSSEQVNPWHCRLGWTEKQGPGAEQQDQQLERETDQKAVTFDLAFTLVVTKANKIHLRDDDHDDGAKKGHNG
jgi:hypothetical protein